MAEIEVPVAIENLAAPAEPIKKAAVIDDAFDDVEAGEIPIIRFREFYQESNENEAFDKVLVNLSIPIPDFSQWTDDSPEFLDFLQTLWTKKDDQVLRPIIYHENLFVDKLDRLDELERLVKNIEGQNITVEKFKSSISNYSVFEKGDFVYIFIDYNLSVKPGHDAVANARKVVKDIYDICPQDKKPVTIIMSSDPGLNESKKEEFQNDAGLLEGVFRLSPKTDLVDKAKVSLLVRAYKEEFYSNHKLQEYIQALTEASKKAQEQFAKEVMTLRIEDYEFIQNSVLQAEQHPLGDYLAWLYSSHWATLLLRDTDLKDKQREIDVVLAKEKPLHHTVPSPKLAEIFMSALFESNLSKIDYHPWEGKDDKVAKLPYLHLGDFFTKKGDANVFMILNPQCDLERPDKYAQYRSILILPGILETIENVVNPNDVKTDFFIYEEKQYRIYWKLTQLNAIPYNEFDEWQNKLQLERHFRLRLPYALEIQQQFTSNMSRVGLPVSPPMSNNITLEVKYKKYDNELMDLVAKSQEYAFLPVARDAKQEVRLTLKFALDFKAALGDEHQIMTELKDSIDSSGAAMPANLVKSIEKLQQFIESFDNWFFDNRFFPYPKEAAVSQLPKNSNTVLITRDFSSPPQFNAQSQFWISLTTSMKAIVIEDELTEEEIENKNAAPETPIVTAEEGSKSQNIDVEKKS